MSKTIREKHHRLPDELYRGMQIVSFTACVKDRVSFFTTRELFNAFEEMLLNELTRFECGAEAYLFMPDHAHFLLCGNSDEADTLKAMRSFKQKSGYWLSRNRPSVHWQKDFYDHIIRENESLQKHIMYILNNPVRKGMVESWKEYPFKGSTSHDLDTWEPV